MSSVFSGEFRVSSAFGNRILNGSPDDHPGVDLVGVTDKNVRAAVGGTVIASEIRYKGQDSTRTWEWGNYVTVLGDDGNKYYYCHMSERDVAVGQRVKAGDIVGVEGNTGYSFGSHCHFEVRNAANVSVDPTPYLGIPNRVGTYDSRTADASAIPADETAEAVPETVTASAPPEAPQQAESQRTAENRSLTGSHPARRAYYKVEFDSVDITEDIAPYLESITYTDNEDEQEDSLSIVLQDREGNWLNGWLQDVIDAGSLQQGIRAWIYRENDNGTADELYCGTFILTGVDASDPAPEITLKASSLGYENGIRQTKLNHAWENGSLSGIVQEIADKAGLGVVLNCEDAEIPAYVAQFEQSDMALLNDLCNANGLLLKVTDSQIVVYNQRILESGDAVGKIVRGDGTYTKANLAMGTANEKYRRCVVKYVTPEGELISGSAEDASAKSSEKTLNVAAYAASESQARKIADSYLRKANLLEKCVNFTMYGNPHMIAGSTLELEGFGPWSGKHMITAVTHKVDGKGGYTTALVTREVHG